MRTLVLGPDEVREALDPMIYPKRQVFLVTPDGEILCCDIDQGWMMFRRPKGLLHRQWAGAVRAAVDALKHQALVARSIHDEIEDRTEPAIPSSVFVHRF